uniref:LTA synthase family protein n=1 Tax=Alistipes putredinis TaxID=28117 RepID=UPI003FD8C7FF
AQGEQQVGGRYGTLGCCLLLQFNTRFQQSANTYANELQATGAYKFYDAFMKNELSYPQFYLTLPQKEAEANVHAIYGSTGDNLRHIPGNPDTLRRNIVLITIESMSASFMQHFGYPDAITPHLDSLYKMGIAFEQCFATGNRTVRGLEAVTLSLPPCPGQSIIKRPRNDNMHSTAAVLREKGYDAYYFYGGNSYFDNMETFFGGNGYRIIDQNDYKPEEVTFANIWGVCDEDAYDKVIRSLGERADTTAVPFFAHVMTVSNHRPYTYPAGRIPIPNDAKLRSGGVMYTDYALGRFFEEASRQPWFANTVFVVTADHCASSAGKTEIPLEKYHIPALIFAPGLIAPRQVDKVVSQIDLMPTLFSLLGMDYDSHFFGQDALSDDFRERAFVATYQDLGYLEGDVFTVLSPVNRAEQYRISPTEEDRYNLVLEEGIPSQELLDRAISLYQTSSAWNTRP